MNPLCALCSNISASPVVEYLTHKGQEGDDNSKPKQAVSRDQEFQLYNFKFFRNWLCAQQLSKHFSSNL